MPFCTLLSREIVLKRQKRNFLTHVLMGIQPAIVRTHHSWLNQSPRKDQGLFPVVAMAVLG